MSILISHLPTLSPEGLKLFVPERAGFELGSAESEGYVDCQGTGTGKLSVKGQTAF